MKLYCHFFSNGKECPHDQECVYLHEESEMCRYMENCEREFCMYQHDIDEDSQESEEDEKDDEKDDDKVDGDDRIDDDVNEKTFCNPSQSDESDDNEVESMKCEHCTFETEDKKRFVRHTFESHSVTGKYACMKCKSEFENRKLFNNHKYFAQC